MRGLRGCVCCVCVQHTRLHLCQCVSVCTSLASLPLGEESVLRALLLSRALDVRLIALYPGEEKPIVLSWLHTQSGSSSTNDFKTWGKKCSMGNMSISKSVFHVFPKNVFTRLLNRRV